MRNILLPLLSIILGFFLSLFILKTYINKALDKKSKKETNTKIKVLKTANTVKNIGADNIQKNFESWNIYNKQNIDLMSTYTSLDNKGAVIDKGMFLTLLRTGAYIAVKSEYKNTIQYKLVSIDDDADQKIKKTISSKATIAYQYFKMEGKKLPNYNFIDLKGDSYNKEDTKGKIVVLKCWFITCKSCVEEFPELNKLVERYKNDNIKFISLAFDEKDKLIEFLKTKVFNYITIPNQKKYMAKKLKVKQYPTHLIIDSNGIIIKMVNNANTLSTELERILGK
ncbi:TlpA family protein disulfide reductase [Tenacibaculum aestuariivivum]|uniref:TlpA family protein disulfide reductase n=1 Tax=Tenacibaculum aestuariivivum TaxID=2006131 RepID=UPI003AB5CE75